MITFDQEDMKLKDLKVGNKFCFVDSPGVYIKKRRINKDGFCLIGTNKPYTDCLGYSGEAEVFDLGKE